MRTPSAELADARLGPRARVRVRNKDALPRASEHAPWRDSIEIWN